MAKKNLKTSEILEYIDKVLVDMKIARKEGYNLSVKNLYLEIDGVITMLYRMDAINDNTMIELVRKNNEARYE